MELHLEEVIQHFHFATKTQTFLNTSAELSIPKANILVIIIGALLLDHIEDDSDENRQLDDHGRQFSHSIDRKYIWEEGRKMTVLTQINFFIFVEDTGRVTL